MMAILCSCRVPHVTLPEGHDIDVRDPDDEIVAHQAFVHVERLDRHTVWVGITTPSGERVDLDLVATRGKLRMLVR